MPGDSKNDCLHWEDVFNATHCHSGVEALFVSLRELKDAALMLGEPRQLGIVASCTHNFAHSLTSQRQLEQCKAG